VNEVKAPRPVDDYAGPSTLPEDEGEMTTSENDKHTPNLAKGQSHSFKNMSDEVAHVGFHTDSYNLLLNLLPIPAFSPSTASSLKKSPSRVYSQSFQACISTCLFGNSPTLLSLSHQLISTCEMARQRTKLAFLCSESFFARFFFLKYILINTVFLDHLVAGSFVGCFFLKFDHYFAEASISPLPESIPIEDAS